MPFGEQQCGEIAADSTEIAGRSGYEDRAVMWRFHRYIAYLVLAFVTGQDAYVGSGTPGVAGPTAGFKDRVDREAAAGTRRKNSGGSQDMAAFMNAVPLLGSTRLSLADAQDDLAARPWP
jgi:hypothetical protein